MYVWILSAYMSLHHMCAVPMKDFWTPELQLVSCGYWVLRKNSQAS